MRKTRGIQCLSPEVVQVNGALNYCYCTSCARLQLEQLHSAYTEMFFDQLCILWFMGVAVQWFKLYQRLVRPRLWWKRGGLNFLMSILQGHQLISLLGMAWLIVVLGAEEAIFPTSDTPS